MIIDEIELYLQQMSLEEKVKLLVGSDFWHTYPIKNNLGLCLTDGPHGVRKQAGKATKAGLLESVPATCFPTASALACSFDENLLYKIGQAIAQECLEEKVDMLLGPGINMKRSPLCGRNFEYYSEDPFLAGKLAANFIQGVQSENVFACVKHFACNNQEYGRMVNDSIVDERTLHEYYLQAFRIAIKEAKPKAVMCSYNKVNGIPVSQNSYLLQQVLRKDYSFEGIVVSDWGAVGNRVCALQAGLDLEMPASLSYYDLIEAYHNEQITMNDIDQSVRRILKLYWERPSFTSIEKKNHHNLAKLAALESMVLLKNDNQILPIHPKEKIGIVGQFTLRFQGAGSSKVNAKKVDSFISCLHEHQIDYHIFSKVTPQLQEMNKVIFFLELSPSKEIEGNDRFDLQLDSKALNLLEQTLVWNQNIIVVLTTGSVVELPFVDSIPGLILTYLSGEASASALYDILFGLANPCGHLAETWIKKLSDHPVENYAKDVYQSIYKERFFVGYRYYDKIGYAPLFPFGYGLSYTSFELTNLILEENKIYFDVKNIGEVKGKVVPQLYVHDTNPNLLRPVRELKGFLKEELNPKEQKRCCFTIEDSFFEYYDICEKCFKVSGGEYVFELGFSVADIRLSTSYKVKGTSAREADNAYFSLKNIRDITLNDFEQVYLKPIPSRPIDYPFTLDTAMCEIQKKWIGKVFVWFGLKALKRRSATKEEYEMNRYTFMTGPIRMIGMGINKTTYQLQGIVDLLNGKFFSGLIRFLKKDKRTI